MIIYKFRFASRLYFFGFWFDYGPVIDFFGSKNIVMAWLFLILGLIGFYYFGLVQITMLGIR